MLTKKTDAQHSSDQTDALFSHLPSRLFAPLASPARSAYAKLLLSLYHAFFDGESFGTHRKDDIVAFIEIEIQRNADMARDFESDEYLEADAESEQVTDSSKAELSQNPNRVYKRLLDAGWIQEHLQGYIINVDIDASISMLYEALDGIDKGEALHFGGTLSAIEAVIEKLGEEPFERSTSLSECARQARRFQQHLTAVVGSLRIYERTLAVRRDPAEVLFHFFDRFVENTLIADYRALKIRNNPFRHRDKIISAISLYESDEQIIDALAKGYLEQGLAATSEEAHSKVLQQLYQVKTVFWRADERLDEIDVIRLRIERRISRYIAYMSQIDGTISTRLTRAISSLASIAGDKIEVPVDTDLSGHVRCWGPDDLATPRTAKARVQPSAIPIQEPDPLIKEYDHRRREYLQRHNITPVQIEAYLDEAAKSNDALDASSFPVEDTQQAIIFQRLRLIPSMGNTQLANRWRITFKGGPLLETEWTTCRDFTVERIETNERDTPNAV